MPAHNEFLLRRITDYWDNRIDAIPVLASHLEGLDAAARATALQDIRSAIAEHVRLLSDELLVSVAYIMADDLYKSASQIGELSETVRIYLMASAGTFLELLRQRGFTLHYVADNHFEDAGLPARVFPAWYAACGIAFICPQVPGPDGGVCTLEDCVHQMHILDGARQHYVFLDSLSTEESFVEPIEQIHGKGVITVMRSAPPVRGTKFSVFLEGRQIGKDVPPEPVWTLH
jgi:hypothetical protein